VADRSVNAIWLSTRSGELKLISRSYNLANVDTIRTLAQARHFFTAELRLQEFGQLLLIGDQAAVERLSQILSEHHEHELIRLSDQPGDEDADKGLVSARD